MALFTPTEGVKREGSKAGWRGSKIYFSEHILHYTQELEEGKREQAGGMKDPKSPLPKRKTSY